MDKHPDHLLKASVRTFIILETERYQNKEDSHGGPGYYPGEWAIAVHDREIGFVDIPNEVKRLYGQIS